MAQLQDEGFHEIQLNGKQLVFLFMAATVVSVVIFLCGVLVGRGVRAERGVAAEAAPTNAVAETAPLPQQPPPAPAPTPAGSDPRTAAAPPPPVDDLTYFNRLEKQNTPPEQLKPADKKAPADRAAVAPLPSAPPAPPPPAVSDADAASSEPAGDGFAVQIAALNVRSEAEAIVKRLASKGYTAYVLAPSTGTPLVFRVRVGKFPTRREAETVAAKLKKEEQFNPWVTR